jgi:hypothetical protein
VTTTTIATSFIFVFAISGNHWQAHGLVGLAAYLLILDQSLNQAYHRPCHHLGFSDKRRVRESCNAALSNLPA